jgi:vacuolar-type H+-ATPase subunit F/Vma7
MAGRCVFIGDVVSAAGYRLAGADCRTPAVADTSALLSRLAGDAGVGLVILTAEYAAALPAAQLEAAIAKQRPPLLVVADIRGRQAPADHTAALKRQLGLAE